MAIASVAINGTPIEDLGLVLIEGGPSLGGLARTRESAAVPGYAGVLQSNLSTTEPRVLRFVFGAYRVTTAAARAAVVDALSDALAGLLEVTFNDGTPRIARGLCRVFQATVALSPTFQNLAMSVVVEIECANAARYEAEPQLLVLGSVPVAIPVGTIPHAGTIYVTGATSTPFQITYRNVAGIELGLLSITPNLAAGESLRLDLATEEATKVSATGVESDVIDWVTQDVWFAVMPQDCDRLNSAWPTLESSRAAAYYFRRNWET